MAVSRVHRPHAAVMAIALLGWSHAAGAQAAASQSRSAMSGADLYQAGCVACHGRDGKGASSSLIGSQMRLPDFTNCEFTTSEPDVDWMAVVRLGGPARRLDRMMPAFGDALSDGEIKRLIDHLRTFCRSPGWPLGDLNQPRSLVTGKAFPENEAFVTTAAPTTQTDRVETRFTYGHRVGARSQYEVVVPFSVARQPAGWNRGLGDISVAFKHVVFDSARRGSIVSASGELTFPTGKEHEGLGRRLTIFEPFGTLSQTLPRGGFVHAQVGFAFPLNIETANDELYWRAAVGKTFTGGRWGRAWSPIVEVLGVRELVVDEPAFWDLLPELHVTLSRRQHVMLNGGIRVPLNLRSRTGTVTVSILWDWSRGGLFSGW